MVTRSLPFALATFMAAALLFLIEPMTAKGLLPILGGSPGVWNTCVLFFQVALLGGYALAHGLVLTIPGRARLIILLIGYSAVLILLPFDPSDPLSIAPLTESRPTFWLLLCLAKMVGLPFLAIATIAPTLQNWFSLPGDKVAQNPYPLYASSNLGGLLGLVAYPVVIEPFLTLSEQGRLWAWGYRFFLGLVFLCGLLTWRSVKSGESKVPEHMSEGPSPGWRQFARWIALATVPASLMLGVTTYLSTDIAAIPLLWIIPLALYQLSFIIVFAQNSFKFDLRCSRWLPPVVSALAIALGFGLVQAWWIPIHLIGFFMVAMVCHGQLARSRPESRFLTGFYLALCVGGVLGGALNTLIAPLIFDRIAEYPLALVLGLFALPMAWPRSRSEFALPCVVGVAIAIAVTDLGGAGDSLLSVLSAMLAIGLIAFAAWKQKSSPARFALTVGAALTASGLSSGVNGQFLRRERSFFGTLRVTTSDDGQYRRFFHGSTLHGIQSLDPKNRDEPLAYFTRSGPFGQLYGAFHESAAPRSVGIVGLGAGAMACYAESDEAWTFYELDPAVAAVASNPSWFTFLKDSRASQTKIVLGDARLKLQEAPDHSFGLIVLDAFSSDAVPVHLLTREALDLYRRKLAHKGLIAFQITNRYLSLEPIIGSAAQESGLTCRVRYDTDLTREESKAGKQGSIWAVVAQDLADLGPIATDPRWRTARQGRRAWTDQFSNMWDALPASQSLTLRAQP